MPALACQEKTKGNRQIPFFRNMSLLTSSHPGRPVASPRGSQGQPPRSPGGAWKVRFWPACSSSPPSKALGVRSLAAVVVYSLLELFGSSFCPVTPREKITPEKIVGKISSFPRNFRFSSGNTLRGPREEQWGCPWDRASIGKGRRSRASRVARLAAGGKRERERSKRAERRKMDVAQIAVQGFFHDPPLGKLKMFIFFHMGISLMCSMFEPDVSAVSVKASSHSFP